MREIDSKTQRRLRNGEEWGKERERETLKIEESPMKPHRT